MDDNKLNLLDRICLRAGEARWSVPGFRRREQGVLALMWTGLIFGNLAINLPFANGVSLWVRMGIPAVYGLAAGIFMWGSARWAEGWSQRYGPTITPASLSRGRLPGFGLFSLIVLIGPILCILPLAMKFHLRTGPVYLSSAFGMLCLVQAYTLTTRSTLSLVVQARGEALRAKLAPHFIFNTLNTLHAQIESDPRAAQATTERLASLFRQVLEAAERPTVPLREELRFVEAYLGIEQARLGERLQVRIEVPEELEACEVPPLSLQVLVENAVKHGVAPLERGGEIRVSARRDGPHLVLEVNDPGPSAGSGQGSGGGSGTALRTLQGRLARPEDLSLGREGERTVAAFRWRQP